MQNLDLNFNFDMDHLDLDALKTDCNSISEENDARSIAVIGIDAKIGDADTVDEIWQAFLEGKNMISELSAVRREDAQKLLASEGRKRSEFARLAYLSRIDLFDPELFNISPMEAEYIDPAQRIFLESAWSALEDAGYGGNKLYGSRTGVYVGYSSKSSFGEMQANIPDEALGLAVSGHANSFMAGRLSYLLNLKGPAIIIDTACSSSMVALHEACRALRNKDITMAVVGSVHVTMCPGDGQKQMGTSSSSGYTKSFDGKADGTGGGEGVINLVLKPLSDAVIDNDHIYGVIKGSCVNQDGKSIGLTAPNSEAQADVITGAWKDAGVKPESITYIEAHGTATKLGDPVEIGGLTAAFSKYTDRKQFCAIGAAKSNFGHLDCAAGLLGVLKVLLMMQNRMIPPTIHFSTPNNKIDYLHSPVYINDKIKKWETDDGILTAGVSSFGLSGTNSHVILQSYEEDKNSHREFSANYLLTASARDKETLMKMLKSYQDFLTKQAEHNFQDFCYTINTGRGQYEHRFAGVFSDESEFLALNETDLLSEKYYSNFTQTQKKETDTNLITQNECRINHERAKQLCSTGHETELAELYLKGTEIDFEPLYEDEPVYRISAPVYPFHHRRFEFSIEDLHKNKKEKQPYVIAEKAINPLLDRCAIESDNLWIFEKQVSLDTCLEIREHCINGVNVLPGTAYVEMAHAVGQYIYGSVFFTYTEITFYNLMVCRHDEKRILHAIAEKDGEKLSLRMLSRNHEDSDWILHAEMSIKKGYEQQTHKKVDIGSLLAEYDKQFECTKSTEEGNFVQLGSHWDCARNVYIGDNSLVLCAQVREELEHDILDYYIFPALLDGSVNAGNILLGKTYLPLNYKNAVFYGELKGRIYSRIVRLNPCKPNREVELFKVEIYDVDGNLLGEVQQYALKRCNEANWLFENLMSKDVHEVCWKPDERSNITSNRMSGTAVVVLWQGQHVEEMLSAVKNRYRDVICLYIGESSGKIAQNSYEVRNTEDEMSAVIRQLKIPEGTVMINLLSDKSDDLEVNEEAFSGLRGTFNLAKALCNHSEHITLACIVKNAGIISCTEKNINPIGRSVMEFVSCLELEQSTIDACIIDTDELTDVELLLDEINHADRRTIVGYRENVRYAEYICKKLDKKEPIVPRDGDVVVIPGGYGGIGLAVSEYLLSHNRETKIVLLSRTGAIEDANDKRFNQLQALIGKGYQISVWKADVTERHEVADAVNRVRKEYGHIDGVIYAAGIGEEGMLVNKTWDDEWKIVKTKAVGVWNIDMETCNDNLRYFIMFSSITSLFGSGGQTGYAAGNAFLDSYVLSSTRKECVTMTINWTGWKESGMAFNWGVDMSKSDLHFVSDEEGRELFGAALRTGLRRIAILRFHNKLDAHKCEELQSRIKLPEEYIMNNKVKEESHEQEIAIYGKSPDNLTEEEKNLALAWSRTLKINEVNVFSKFFEIGGNSLLASYLQKEINKIYPSTVAITDVFAYSTIVDMAAYISEKNGTSKEHIAIDQNKDADIEDLVQQFVQGDLSIEEMEHLI